MEREDELIGEIIAARGLAQMLCFLLVGNGTLARETVETGLTSLVAQWGGLAHGPEPKPALHAGIAAMRLGEFLAEFRGLTGGVSQ
ncbi:MAG: hypothetical protein KGL44_09070 [Sphingomonadales bacterium]|nr:hypothetical protein [Sphingomonadales bacterium]